MFGFRKNYKAEWTEDSVDFISSLYSFGSPKDKSIAMGSSLSSSRFKLVLLVIFLPLFIILVRLIYLQVYNFNNFALLAEKNRQRIINIPAERGHIIDRQGRTLTKNVPNFLLAIRPQDLPTTDALRSAVIKRLSEIIELPEYKVANILKQYGSYSFESIVIKEDLDYETALSTQIDATDLEGIEIQRSSKRLYRHPFKSDQVSSSSLSISHILGYLGKLSTDELTSLYSDGYLPTDSIGKTGLEKTYERILRGEYGSRTLEVDAQGRLQSVIEETPPSPGNHIKLSLDIDVQIALEDALLSMLEENDKTRGAAIAMDPNTGDILGIVSLPAYDNNDFSGGISEARYKEYIEDEDLPLFNRSISGTYPSGSTIKPAIGSAALQEGIVKSNTSFLSQGGIRINQWFFPDWQPGGHGRTNLRRALAWSVNTYFYYVGGGYNNFEGLGVDKITDYLRKFGFARKLGIDIPGEQPGFLPSKEWKQQTKNEPWYIGDTYNLSIGQGDVLVTPLQIAAMTAAVANNGTLFKPKLVFSTVDPLTSQENKIAPEVLEKDFISEVHMNYVRLGMRDCVLYGSCRRLSNLPLNIAGKTGTAQWSSLHEPHAWFTSFAPYEKPEIVVTVIVEEGEEGSGVALPVAERFYRWYVDR